MIWKSKFNQLIVQFADFLTAFISFIFSYLFWKLLYPIFPSIIPNPFQIDRIILFISVLLSILIVFMFRFHGAYQYLRFTSLKSEYKYIVKVSFWTILISIVFFYLIGQKHTPRTAYFLSFFVLIVFFIIQKTILFYIARYLRKHNHGRKRIILFGTGTRSKQFIDTVENNFKWGLDIVGLITSDKNKVGHLYYGKKVVGIYNNLEKIFKEFNPQEIIITISTRNFHQIRIVFEICEREGVQVRLNSDFFSEFTRNIKIDNIYGLNIISFYKQEHNELKLLFKRIIDIIGAIIALILFCPFMIIAAFGIAFTDGFPLFYAWNVIGLDKKPFKSWKFRTMVKDADKLKKDLLLKNEMNGPVFKITNDPRIIPFGYWLRKWSIDETPQFFSVIKGDMSLVGPRPAGPHELERYESWHRRKLSIKPGITCLWQVKGRNAINNFDDWVKFDLEYIDNWNIWLDFKIIFRTIISVFKGSGK